MALAQQTRLVRVDSPLGAEVLQLQRMEGREELGRPFAYELELISETPDLPSSRCSATSASPISRTP